ncbi:MAG: RNA-binding domain-containing protein [Candidatus Woesearchaeota archaeon]
MKVAHNIKLTAFSYEEDDKEQIRQGLLKLVPFDLEQEKLELSQTNAQGFKEKRIIIFELFMKKERNTTKFLKHIKDNLTTDQRNTLLEQIESRLDEELNFFIRIDKSRFLKDGVLTLTEQGNCYHIKINIAAYPSNREKALEIVQEWLAGV